jgi:hypothetical protein
MLSHEIYFNHKQQIGQSFNSRLVYNANQHQLILQASQLINQFMSLSQ